MAKNGQQETLTIFIGVKVILGCKKNFCFKITKIMNFLKNSFINWIAALAVAMSALAPAVSQAVSLAKHGQGFVMEICAADGTKSLMDVQNDERTDLADSIQPCPYCVTHDDLTSVFNTNLNIQSPQGFALFPKLFYQSPKPLAVWFAPPSTAPPTQA